MDHKTEKRRAERMAKIDRLAIPGNSMGMPPLIKVLTDPDEHIRAAAATGLGHIGDKAACPSILPLLHDPEVKVRWAAAHALGFLGDKTTIHHLAEAMFDPVDDVSLMAIMSIQWLGAAHAMPSLVKLLNTESRLVRQAAQSAIVQLGVGAVEPLLQIIKTGNRSLRRTASELLILLGEVAVPQLTAAQESDDPEIRQVTAQILRKYKIDSTSSELQEALMDMSNPERRLAIRQTLVDMKAVEILINVLVHSESPIQEEVSDALTEIGEAAIAPLITTIAEVNEGIRQLLMIPLKRMGDIAVTQLLTNLFEADLGIRLGSAWALGEIADPKAVLGLLRALRDEGDVIRWVAAHALGTIADESAMRGLVKAIEDSNAAVRIEAACSLSKMGMFTPLLTTFRNSKPEIKWAAGVAIAEMPARLLPEFEKAWKHTEDVHLEVSETLQQIILFDLVPNLPTEIIDIIEQILNSKPAAPFTAANTAS